MKTVYSAANISLAGVFQSILEGYARLWNRSDLAIIII
jgi:hypothetical protein